MITYETENAVFEFDRSDVEDQLKNLDCENLDKEVAEILKLLSSITEAPVLKSESFGYFGYIALDLLEAGKGLVTCKLCHDKNYQPHQLKPITVGHGRSPFDLKPELRGGVLKKLFGKKRNPALLGGKGFECPQGHELIAMTAWIT